MGPDKKTSASLIIPLRVFTVFIALLFPLSCAAWCPCAGGMAAGPGLNVERLGYGWLVPDEQADTFINPAYITAITGRRLFSWFSPSITSNQDAKSSDSALAAGLFIVTPFEAATLGVKYRPFIAYSSREYSLYSTNALVESFDDSLILEIFAGFPAIGSLSLGASLGYDSDDSLDETDYSSPAFVDLYGKTLSRVFSLKIGAILDVNESFNFGASASCKAGAAEYGGNAAKRDDNILKMNFSLLPEFKPSENLLLRGYAGLDYESVLSSFYENGVLSLEDESRYYLGIGAGFGLFYAGKDGSSFSLCIKTGIVPGDITRDYASGVLETESESGLYSWLFAGAKKEFFNGLIFISTGYKIMKFESYTRVSSRHLGRALLSRASADYSGIIVFPGLAGNAYLILGARPDKNLYAAVNLGKTLLNLSSGPEKSGQNVFQSGIEAEVDFIY